MADKMREQAAELVQTVVQRIRLGKTDEAIEEAARAIAEGVATEREAIAKMCHALGLYRLAADIRARTGEGGGQ